MSQCFFVSDLHGQADRYQALFPKILKERPAAVFMGGDLLPPFHAGWKGNFIRDYLAIEFRKLKEILGKDYPRVFLILGNDDGSKDEQDLISIMADDQIWEYIHNRLVQFGLYSIYGYSYVPPTPFLNKDWERYDISRFVDPGCIPPEEGKHTQKQPLNLIQNSTIKQDLDDLVGDKDLSQSIFLFHTPPYQTKLDRAALDGKKIDHVPLDCHVGSIAVKNMILEREPLITMHGHVHESARITGSWKDTLGMTSMFSGAHDGPELALVKFDPDNPQMATRELC